VTEAEWLAHRDPDPMLGLLRKRASDRKLRLFACACCRRAWPLLDARSQRLVEMSEDYLDGLAGQGALSEASERHRQVWREHPPESAAHIVGWVVGVLVSGGAWAAALNAVEATLRALRRSGLMAESDRELVAQAELLREVIGNPFRRATVDPSWLASHDGAVTKVARSVSEGRSFADTPVLADALEDAGCSDVGLLGHLRGPGPHVRGCWALDLILGKE
jgi:hypothetical protein